MSSNPFNTPLVLEIRPSFQKWLIIAVPHLFVLSVVLSLATISWPMRIILCVPVIFSSGYYFRLHLQQSLKKSVKTLYQDSAKNWLIKTNENEEERKIVLLCSSTFISNFLILLNVSGENKHHYRVLITPDSIPKKEFRQLKIRIKMHKI